MSQTKSRIHSDQILTNHDEADTSSTSNYRNIYDFRRSQRNSNAHLRTVGVVEHAEHDPGLRVDIGRVMRRRLDLGQFVLQRLGEDRVERQVGAQDVLLLPVIGSQFGNLRPQTVEVLFLRVRVVAGPDPQRRHVLLAAPVQVGGDGREEPVQIGLTLLEQLTADPWETGEDCVHQPVGPHLEIYSARDSVTWSVEEGQHQRQRKTSPSCHQPVRMVSVGSAAMVYAQY